MPPTQRAVLLIASICFLAFVLLLVRKNRLSAKYSLLWIALGGIGILAAAVPGWVFAVSAILGFEEPVNFLTFACIFYLMAVVFTCVSIVSDQSARIRGLIQDVSLLNGRVSQLESAIAAMRDERGADTAEGKEMPR